MAPRSTVVSCDRVFPRRHQFGAPGFEPAEQHVAAKVGEKIAPSVTTHRYSRSCIKVAKAKHTRRKSLRILGRRADSRARLDDYCGALAIERSNDRLGACKVRLHLGRDGER